MREVMSYLYSSALLLVLFCFIVAVSGDQQHPIHDIDIGNPRLIVTSTSFDTFPQSVQDACGERVRLVGQSRMQLISFASSFHVSVMASDDLPSRYHDKIQLCFHWNASVETCNCEKEWASLQNGQWDAFMSPFQNRYIGVKFPKGATGSVIISIEEEIQYWRLACLGIGFVLLLLAPIVSKWAPFYYTSSMLIGTLLVVLFLLFQGMKLLPTGRKNFLYLTIYGSLVGAGSLLVHYFSMFINSILLNFGLGEDLHNPVSVFVLLCIILAGAALGFWIVRKFVLSEDGDVDIGVAQFVKWAMRAIAILFFLQSSLDYPLALSAILVCWKICSFIHSRKRSQSLTLKNPGFTKENIWQQRAREAAATHRQAEFLCRSGIPRPKRTWGGPSTHNALSNYTNHGSHFLSPRRRAMLQKDYYSTFHKTPMVRKYSKVDWNEFTQESTRDALSDWASTPEVRDWITDNAKRIRLDPKDVDSTNSSCSSSSEETVEESPINLFHWI